MFPSIYCMFSRLWRAYLNAQNTVFTIFSISTEVKTNYNQHTLRRCTSTWTSQRQGNSTKGKYAKKNKITTLKTSVNTNTQTMKNVIHGGQPKEVKFIDNDITKETQNQNTKLSLAKCR
ncbi:hypothetical protein RND81_06G134600 [Saponaria officinalis]|uniref:Secreted protein n=1 Tax=Saponaria officinalis TaxID=3572 RepID=A0AAW1KBI5_SAPOF